MIKSVPTRASNIKGKLTNVQYVILHASGRSKWATDKNELDYLTGFHANGFCYHDYIFSTGEYYNLAPLNALLWHAGAGKINGKLTALNAISIGVAMGGENLPSSLYPKAQYDAAVKGVALRLKQLNLTQDKVLGHKEVSAYRGKSDPAAFDMNKFRDDVYLEMKRSEVAAPEPLKQAPRKTIVIQNLNQSEVIYRGNYLATDFGDKVHFREVNND